MATNHHRRSFSGHLAALILLYILAAGNVSAQPPPNGNNNNNNNSNLFQTAKFNPSMAVIIVVLVSAFFFLGFFSIYIRQCGGGRIDSFAATAATALGARSRRQRGLDPAILDTFPKLIYSEVKDHKIGKGALECAICLNEFEDEDTIRLLSKCDHAFHQECIDAWLENHVTCPVCRTNYADAPAEPAPVEVAAQTLDPPQAVPPAADQVVIAVDDGERRQEMKELARIASRLRRNGSRRPRAFSRSHSTGHSMMLQSEGLDRYTLRLPENVRRDIMLQREGSLAGARGGEGSSRRVSRAIGEDGRGRGGRSVRLGRSDRWPTFFARSLSAKIPAWGNWRRGEEGSVKEGSTKAKFAGGGLGKTNRDDSESSTAALNPV